MEPISGYWFVDIGVAILLYALGNYFLGMLKAHRRRRGKQAPPERRKITDPGVIYGVEQLLLQHRIEGDFEVRDGKVHLPVPPERLSPLANVLGNAAAHVARQRNPNSISIYYRDSVQDKFHLMPDIDFDILREAASVMRRVAADRDLSKRLYEGMSKDEKQAMARAILSTFWQKRGLPDRAFEYRSGVHDDDTMYVLVIEVIDAIYEIKGVKPQ